ncbi:MAG: acyltransferase family protein [Halorubrum sp.]
MGERVHSVDAMRIVAVVFVVLIHTDPFQGLGTAGNAVNFAIKTTARFAVPFFFVTSGYFFALKVADRDPRAYLTRRTVTLASLYAFGLFLAAPTFLGSRVARDAAAGRPLVDAVLAALAEFLDPIELLYYGTSVSDILWFLPALAVSLALVGAVTALGRAELLLPVALCLHVVGLLGTSYTMIVDVPFEVRDGLFFGFFYTSLGYTIGLRGWTPSRDRSGTLLGLVGAFAVLQLVEFYLLGYPLRGESFGSYVFPASYGVTTALLTLSLFLFLLSKPGLGADTPLPSWGVYAVGIYVTHPVVLAAVRGLRDALASAGHEVGAALFWHLGATPATLLGALALYRLADRVGLVEIGGTHFPGAPLLASRRSE